MLCMPCLDRWFSCAQPELRAEKGLTPLLRRCCPVCRCELRTTGAEMRTSDAGKFWYGMTKILETWD